ncbi:3-carboxy-cis,cis-muconate cycloisomerase [Streptomyces zagrosensis]|uniref:3-carboxy-cis,cis-muconate cycloisomerase n=1 Tax=Streptomyces zagrosensis TaxID=1042984 RepID=UPI001FE772B4|nr:3-carboxy-cis,cis-muconate cycloisomerase [Streptomyces zagrosensis]
MSGAASTAGPYRAEHLDVGLLAPVRAASPTEVATADYAYLQAMLDAEAALTRAQATVGLAPESAARTVTAAARADRFDLASLAARAGAGGNPVIPLVADLTRAVATVAAEDAEYVHRGPTSQDIVDTACMLVTARALDLIAADLQRAAEALGPLAARHRDTPLAGRTLTQHAVPTTFGLKAAGWRALVLDAYERITRVRAALPVQLGGAAGTLAAFHAYASGTTAGSGGDVGLALTTAYASELGLVAPELPWHVLRTPIADIGAALAVSAGALGKIAEDVLVLSRTEIAEVSEGSGGGSSAMPHKANPVRATLISSVARQVPALAMVLFGSLAAPDERPAGPWHAEWQPLRDALRLTGGAAHTAAELCAGLVVHPDRMRDNLAVTGGLLLTERLAAELGAVIGRDRAKTLLARVSRRATEQGIELADALRAEPQLAGVLPEPRLRELTDPVGHLGSAGALTDRALGRAPRPSHPRQDSP